MRRLTIEPIDQSVDAKIKTNKVRNSERGQAIILMVLLITGLVAIAGLAVDGGRLYYSQRTAQNAADNAALAAAWAACSGGNVNNIAFASALTNGYDNDGSTNTVNVNRPPNSGPNVGDNEYIEVVINSVEEAGFSQLVFSGSLESTVRAVGQCTTAQALSHALFAGSNSCNNAINVSGSSSSVSGGVHSNNDMKFSGSSNFIDGDVTYVSSVDGAGNVTYNPPPPDNPTQTSEISYPIDFAIDDYAPGGAKAVAAQNDGGRYYSCNCKMDLGWFESQALYDSGTGILEDGLYYTTDEIDINGSVTASAATFVARDKISFSGSSQTLSPYVDGLLVYTDLQKSGGSQCSSAVISFSGSAQAWTGIIFAPNGLVSLSGSSSTTFSGSIISYTIDVSGSNQNIQFNQALVPPPPPVVNLAE